jgi:amidase
VKTDLHYATLTEIADAIARREVSPVELTQALLERIGRLEPRIGSYATVTPDVALAQARRAQKEITSVRSGVSSGSGEFWWSW